MIEKAKNVKINYVMAKFQSQTYQIDQHTHVIIVKNNKKK